MLLFLLNKTFILSSCFEYAIYSLALFVFSKLYSAGSRYHSSFARPSFVVRTSFVHPSSWSGKSYPARNVSTASANSFRLLTFNTLLHNGAYLGMSALAVRELGMFGIQPDGNLSLLKGGKAVGKP